jgi:hypothetical protein
MALPDSLTQALAEAQALAERGWTMPEPAAIAEAERLLALVAPWRAPAVLAEPDGAIALEWEVGTHGWLQLRVRGSGQLEHSAVIDGDEYGQLEDFTDRLPPWAETLLKRLLLVGH